MKLERKFVHFVGFCLASEVVFVGVSRCVFKSYHSTCPERRRDASVSGFKHFCVLDVSGFKRRAYLQGRRKLILKARFSTI